MPDIEEKWTFPRFAQGGDLFLQIIFKCDFLLIVPN